MKIKEVEIERGRVGPIQMKRNFPIKGNEQTAFSNYSFASVISGPPGSGKSSWLFSQLTNPKGLLYRKFHRVHVFSPSLHTIKKEIALPEKNLHSELDWETVEELINQNKEDVKSGEDKQMLLIFDDLLTEISKGGKLPVFQRMILNRAHAFVSVCLTTQTYNKIPLSLRKNFNILVQFKAKKKELGNIRDELTDYDENEWKQITKYVFDDTHNYMVITNDGRIYKNTNLLEIDEEDDLLSEK